MTLKVKRDGKSRLQWDKVQDSGTRTAFGTGSQRDTQDGKGRYDLIPTSMLHRLAQHYENGAVKYGENNWQKGQSLAQYFGSAMRHLLAIRDADLSEDHFAAAIWNIAAMIHHVDAMLDDTLPVELDSFGIIRKLREIERDQKLAEYKPSDTHTIPLYVPYSGTDFKVMTSGGYNDDSLPLPKIDKTVWDADRFKDIPPDYEPKYNTPPRKRR